MNVYLDTSVVLRRLLRQRNAFRGWGDWDGAYSSVIMRVETLRTIGTDTLFLTHDRQLALGARSMGFEVKGV